MQRVLNIILQNFFDNMSYGYGSDYRYDSGEFINNGSYTASTKGIMTIFQFMLTWVLIF